jgi:hypothetical protein
MALGICAPKYRPSNAVGRWRIRRVLKVQGLRFLQVRPSRRVQLLALSLVPTASNRLMVVNINYLTR